MGNNAANLRFFCAGGLAAGKGYRAEGHGVLVEERRYKHGTLLGGAMIQKPLYAALKGKRRTPNK